MRIPPFAIPTLVVLVAGVAAGADSEDLTLDQACSIALRNQPLIAASRDEAEAARRRTDEVRSAYYPTLVASATAARANDDLTRITAGGLSNPTVYDRDAVGVSLTQLVTDFGHTWDLVKAATLESVARDHAVELAREEVVLEVSAAFYRELEAEATGRAAQDALKARQLVLDQTTQLAAGALKSQVDVALARVGVEETALLVQRADDDRDRARLDIDLFLAQEAKRPYRLVETDEPARQVEGDDQLVQAASRSSPLIRELEARRESAYAFARAQSALGNPTLSIIAAAGITPDHDSRLAGQNQYSAAALNLSVPLFSGGLNVAQHEEALLTAKAADERLRAARERLERDVRAIASGYRYAQKRVEAAKALAEHATEAYELEKARYDAGQVTIVDLSQAQASQTQAMIEGVRARYELGRRLLEIEIATGSFLQRMVGSVEHGR